MIRPYDDLERSFMFRFKYDTRNEDLDRNIGQILADKRCKGLWIEAEEDYVYLILFNTWQPKALDIYMALGGEHLTRLDCITLACIMNALGIELRKDVILYDCSRMHNDYDLMA